MQSKAHEDLIQGVENLEKLFKRQNIYINKSIQIYSSRKKRRGEQYAAMLGRNINLPASRAI